MNPHLLSQMAPRYVASITSLAHNPFSGTSLFSQICPFSSINLGLFWIKETVSHSCLLKTGYELYSYPSDPNHRCLLRHEFVRGRHHRQVQRDEGGGGERPRRGRRRVRDGGAAAVAAGGEDDEPGEAGAALRGRGVIENTHSADVESAPPPPPPPRPPTPPPPPSSSSSSSSSFSFSSSS